MTSNATLEVCLLGEATVRADGEPVDAFDSPRLIELVARLVLQAGTPLDRSTLAFALWPDSSDAQARTNLRHLLHDLRRALPDVDAHVDITNAKIGWRTDTPACVDVVEFTCALDAGDLDAAVGHYGGDLLPGIYTDDVLAERQRLADRAAEALRQLATIAATHGDHDDVIERARQLLAIDPLSELGYQLLMAAHAARGERATALRLYHTLVDLLATELGVEPSPATQSTYASLSHADPAIAPAADPPAASRERAASTLVGRDSRMGDGARRVGLGRRRPRPAARRHRRARRRQVPPGRGADPPGHGGAGPGGAQPRLSHLRSRRLGTRHRLAPRRADRLRARRDSTPVRPTTSVGCSSPSSARDRRQSSLAAPSSSTRACSGDGCSKRPRPPSRPASPRSSPSTTCSGATPTPSTSSASPSTIGPRHRS